MSLNLVSPGVKVREVDLTIGRVDGINDQVGAIAGPFEKGPINTPILIQTEQDLLKTFGKPISTDAQYEYWMSASSYLSYGGILRVMRSDGTTLNNANSGVSASSVTAKIKSYEDYVTTHQYSTDWRFAAKNPGRWANNLKVCVIDGFADQTISGVSTAGLSVGLGITQSVANRVVAGSGSTSSLDGYLRGVITGLGNSAVYVKVTERVSAAGTAYDVNYTEGGTYEFLAPEVGTVNVVVGVATTAGTISEDFDVSITGIVTTGIQLGDLVAGSNVSTGTTVVSIGTSTITVDKVITAGIGTYAFTFTRNSTTTTVINTIDAVSTAGAVSATFNSTGVSVSDWYNQQTLGLTNSTIYWKSIAERPKTSEYAAQRNAKNDEIHVVIVDDSGSLTGTSGNVVEKFTNLSKSFDGKISPSESVYYKDYLATTSEYVYAGHPEGGSGSDTSKTSGNEFAVSGTANWGSAAQGTSFSVAGNKTYTLTGGENYNSTGGMSVALGDVLNSYELIKNESEYSVNFLIGGPSGGSSVFDSQAKANKLIEIAELRKDCIACISPHKAGVVNVSNSDTQTTNIINFFDSLTSSSYAVFDSGYKYVFDRFNNQFRYIPCNADVAGLMARTSITQYPWFSPAGATRGSINGAIKLAYTPSPAQRDLLYPKRINPIISSPGAGIILFGDKTALSYSSAFDRINVRRLFLTIEGTIERAARAQLFEFNDVITRSNFVNIVEPYLRDVKSKRGITDFVVICDETNNTPDVIDSNQFRADIFVKPARSINFIGLTFVATRTGVSFEEVVGNV
jgi:phage tail sheath protein FI